MSRDHLDDRNLVLSDLVNRVLDKGVAITGHVTISIADIDLLELDLKLLLTSIETATRRQLTRDNGYPSLLPPPDGE